MKRTSNRSSNKQNSPSESQHTAKCVRILESSFPTLAFLPVSQEKQAWILEKCKVGISLKADSLQKGKQSLPETSPFHVVVNGNLGLCF